MFRDDGLVLGDRTLSVDEYGVHITNDLLREEVSWKLITSITSQNVVLVLWTDPFAGIFIDRSAFANAEHEQQFIAFVQSKINPSAC